MGVKALALNVLARTQGVPSDVPLGTAHGTLAQPKRVAESDPYAERMQAAWLQVCQPDYPVGMIPWLGEVHPRLYSELTERLPDQIQQLWSEGSSLELFESVLMRLISLHRQCCELYRAGKLGCPK